MSRIISFVCEKCQGTSTCFDKIEDDPKGYAWCDNCGYKHPEDEFQRNVMKIDISLGNRIDADVFDELYDSENERIKNEVKIRLRNKKIDSLE